MITSLPIVFLNDKGRANGSAFFIKNGIARPNEEFLMPGFGKSTHLPSANSVVSYQKTVTSKQ